MQPIGGTELQYAQLYKHVDNDLLNLEEENVQVGILNNIKVEKKVDEDKDIRYKELCFTFGIHY